MIDKLKNKALKQGMKLMSNPTIMKWLGDPRFINAINRGFEIKNLIQNRIHDKLRFVAHKLNLATQKDINSLEQSIRQIESNVNSLKNNQNM